MVTLTSNVQAPTFGLAACILKIDERAALPKTSTCVLHKSLDLRFIPRLPHASWVQEEPAFLAVFQERARRTWVERIGAGDRGREVVEHQALGAALEERPRLL